MAVPFSNTKLRVPAGFRNILEGLAREVLREQPGDIFFFGASYFKGLLEKREETGQDPAKAGAELEDREYNNRAFNKFEYYSDPDILESVTKSQGPGPKPVSAQQRSVEERLRQQQEGYARTLDAENGQKMGQDLQNRQQEQPSAKEPEATKPQQEEEVDIDLTDPEVERAAMKIQAGFRGHLARQESKSTDPDLVPHYRILEETEHQAVPPTPANSIVEQPPEEEVDIDLTDPEVEKAALKIQSGFRGHLGRKEVKKEEENDQPEVSPEPPKPQQEEEVDIDLTDPEVAKAALKIQSGFRGHQARHDVNKMKAESSSGTSAMPLETPTSAQDTTAQSQSGEKQQEEEIDIDLNDPDVEKAAVKIQGVFKGMQFRKKKDEGPSSQPSPTSQQPPEGNGSNNQTQAPPGNDQNTNQNLEDEILASADPSAAQGQGQGQIARDHHAPQGQD